MQGELIVAEDALVDLALTADLGAPLATFDRRLGQAATRYLGPR